MKKLTVTEIAKNLKEMIEGYAMQMNKKDSFHSSWKQHYDDVMSELESERIHAEDTLKDFKEENLTFNAIELEGYLRGIKTMYNRFKSWETKEN